jgi:hypothetical protein
MMKLIVPKFLAAILLAGFFVFTLLSVNVRAEGTQFQNGSESVLEETTQTVDGKTTRTTRMGKARTRTGEARVGEIEESEVNVIERRQKALRLTSFGFGPYASGSVGEHKTLYGFSYGKHWEVSTTGEIVAEILYAGNGDGGLANLGLGYSIIPLRSEFSPIFGAEFGLGTGKGNADSTGAGFSVQVHAGVRAFRLADVQMELMATYTALLSNASLDAGGLQLRVLY